MLVLVAQGRLHEIKQVFSSSRSQLPRLILAAAMISCNWLLFVVAVQIGRAREASLGYYIFPLVAVVMGAALLSERLTTVQWAAVSIAACAVLILTIGLGASPWISLVLACTFAVYGIVKRNSRAGPVVSVAAETLLTAPFAVAWLVGVHFAGWVDFDGRSGGYFGRQLLDSGMLVFSGLLTAGPLILLSYATKRIRYAEVGLISYLNPTIMFLVAVFVFKEPFTVWHGIAFAGIWIALFIYSADLLARGREVRSSAMTSPTEFKTEK